MRQSSSESLDAQRRYELEFSRMTGLPLEQPVAAHPWPLAPHAVVPADNDDDGGGVVVSTPRLAPKPIRPENRDYVPGGCAPASPAASGLFSCL